MVAPVAVLKLAKRINDVVTFAQHVVLSMNGNPDLPEPPLSLSTLQSDIDALAHAQAAVLSRARGSASARDACLARVVLDLQRLRAYVQTVAHGLEATEAARVIASSGLAMKRTGVHPKQAAAAVPGPVSGAVRLTAPFAGKRAAYSWEYAEGEAEWSALPDTMQASTTIDALTPGRGYRFRARAHTSAGIGDWSNPVVFLAV
jgi:hypothetical protein